MSDIEFHILFRKPKYPVIIISADKLYAAFNIKQLAKSCVDSILVDDKEKTVKVIDSTGEEFWYSPENYVLAPGFFCKKWAKKRIIDTYNGSFYCGKQEQMYSTKSLSSKRLDRIMLDICNTIKNIK
ncbi:MAG: hypothetical protein KKC76_12445 [Proteobacteria bacterium]|nr:hypothetical protein [Pseudomonadota bacterium]MBU4295350.1 hypothetical protein [Pseudomonadota bacterium]MCG2748206.1 hypothetical protein [Desulfobulbaceae bacterium]